MRKPLPLALLVLALAPASSAAGDFDRIYDDYKADGEISACLYSDAQLESAAGQVPPDIEQYAPDFVDQLSRARERRASGACAEKPRRKPRPAVVVPPPPPERRPPAPREAPVVGEPPAPEAPVREVLSSAKAPPVSTPAATGLPSGGGDAPAPVWLLAGLGVLAALAAAAAALAWLLGWSPERWTRPLAASAADAGGRTADLAGEFWDWVRLGR